jgi:zinc protease
VVPTFFTTAREIAADLAAKPVSADELERVVEPLRQQIQRAGSSTAFFMQQTEGATQDPERYKAIRSLLVDYTGVSPQAIQQLAAKYLTPEGALRVAVIGDKAQVPPRWPPQPKRSAEKTESFKGFEACAIAISLIACACFDFCEG